MSVSAGRTRVNGFAPLPDMWQGSIANLSVHSSACQSFHMCASKLPDALKTSCETSITFHSVLSWLTFSWNFGVYLDWSFTNNCNLPRQSGRHSMEQWHVSYSNTTHRQRIFLQELQWKDFPTPPTSFSHNFCTSFFQFSTISIEWCSTSNHSCASFEKLRLGMYAPLWIVISGAHT